jgi:hypothetical protein
MLPDRERDILRVQAKNFVRKLRREYEEGKLEGRENATIRRASGDNGVPTPGTTESVGGGGGGEEEG